MIIKDSGVEATLVIEHIEVVRADRDGGGIFWLRPLASNKFLSLEDLRQHYKRSRVPPLPNRLTVTVDPATVRVEIQRSESTA